MSSGRIRDGGRVGFGAGVGGWDRTRSSRNVLPLPGPSLVAARWPPWAAAIVRLIASPAEMNRVQPGDILVTDMTDPDWDPVMKRAAAIVTNRGGRTCHAAIVARELGIPAVVGAGNATTVLKDGELVTVSCAEGDTGKVYAGKLAFEVETLASETLPEPPVKLMMNVGNPERAFEFAQIPNHGVGLARLEFIIARMIGVHPLALLDYAGQTPALRDEIDARTAGYADPVSFYVDKLAEGIATLAAAFWPQPVDLYLFQPPDGQPVSVLGETLQKQQQGERWRYVVKTGNRDFAAPDFRVLYSQGAATTRRPADVLVLQRRNGGNAYGWLVALREDNEVLTAQDRDALLLQRLNQEVVAALQSPDVIHSLTQINVQPRPGTPAQLAELLGSEIRRWGGVIKSAGIPQQ